MSSQAFKLQLHMLHPRSQRNKKNLELHGKDKQSRLSDEFLNIFAGFDLTDVHQHRRASAGFDEQPFRIG